RAWPAAVDSDGGRSPAVGAGRGDDRSNADVRTTPAARHPAPMRNARWYPLVSAAGRDAPWASRFLEWMVETLASTARPSAAPSWSVTFARSEATPDSVGPASAMASETPGANARPAPTPNSSIPGRTSVT